MRPGRLHALQLGALLLALAGCLAVVAHEIAGSRPTHQSRLTYQPGGKPPLRPAHTPRPRPLHRSHLDGYWRAVGYVTTGDGALYAVHTRLDRRWLFLRTCKEHRCRLSFARSSTSGVLFAPVRGNGPVWTTAFARYGLMMCGPANHPVATHLTSRWRFYLSSTQLDATEHITLAPICRATPLEIEWLAHPLALPSRPATQAGAPHRS